VECVDAVEKSGGKWRESEVVSAELAVEGKSNGSDAGRQERGSTFNDTSPSITFHTA